MRIILETWQYLLKCGDSHYEGTTVINMLTHFLLQHVSNPSQIWFSNTFFDWKYLNTLRPWQNGCHFTDDISECIYLNKNECSDNGLAPIRRQSIFWIKDGLVYWCIYASLSLNELISTPMSYWVGLCVEHKDQLNKTLMLKLIHWGLNKKAKKFQTTF